MKIPQPNPQSLAIKKQAAGLLFMMCLFMLDFSVNMNIYASSKAGLKCNKKQQKNHQKHRKQIEIWLAALIIVYGIANYNAKVKPQHESIKILVFKSKHKSVQNCKYLKSMHEAEAGFKKLSGILSLFE